MSKAHLHLFEPSTGKWVPATGDIAGSIGGGGGGGSSSSPSPVSWSYVAASGGIADTSDVTLVAATSGLVNYLQSMQITNQPGAASTQVVIKTGSTVLWRGYAASGDSVQSVTFSQPLMGAVGTSLTAAAITTAASLLINAQGYVSQSVDQLLGSVSESVEIFTAAGEALGDNAGNQLVQGYP